MRAWIVGTGHGGKLQEPRPGSRGLGPRLPVVDGRHRLVLDSEYYDAWARQIAAGDWMGGPRAFSYDPLYTYLLALVYRACGHDLLVVRLLQAALVAATCALTALIGRRLPGPAPGNLAALAVAPYCWWAT